MPPPGNLPVIENCDVTTMLDLSKVHATYQFELMVYWEVQAKMDSVDKSHEEAITHPTMCNLAIFWFQMLLALIESPIHIVYHSVLLIPHSLFLHICTFIEYLFYLLLLLSRCIYAAVLSCTESCSSCCTPRPPPPAMVGAAHAIPMASVMVSTPQSPNPVTSKGGFVPIAVATPADDSGASLAVPAPNAQPGGSSAAAPAPESTLFFLVFIKPLVLFHYYVLRSFNFHLFILKNYSANLSFICANLCHPRAPKLYPYADRFISLIRPPAPINPDAPATTGFGGSSDTKCCGCCFHLLDCCRSVIELIREFTHPIGSAGRSPEHFVRSLYFSLSCCCTFRQRSPHQNDPPITHFQPRSDNRQRRCDGPSLGPAHPSVFLGSCCSCCRALYEDYDGRGLKWLAAKEAARREETVRFYEDRVAFPLRLFDEEEEAGGVNGSSADGDGNDAIRSYNKMLRRRVSAAISLWEMAKSEKENEERRVRAAQQAARGLAFGPSSAGDAGRNSEGEQGGGVIGGVVNLGLGAVRLGFGVLRGGVGFAMGLMGGGAAKESEER